MIDEIFWGGSKEKCLAGFISIKHEYSRRWFAGMSKIRYLNSLQPILNIGAQF
jgi:hypothetical protein